MVRAFLALAVLGLSVIAARAQEYPSRPVRIFVPYAPGGVVDVSARVVGEKLGDVLGQQIVIENRTGASGMLSASMVAKAPADGYTLLFCPGDVITIASLKPNVNIDVATQFAPIAMVNANPMLIAANASAPFGTMKQMVEAAKAITYPFAYGTPGRGTLNDIVGQWIAIETHINLQTIPYQGGAQAANGVASGEIPLGIFSPPPIYPGLVDAGRIKVLALTGKGHPSYLPSSWPTLIESGFPIDVLSWQGLFAPAGTPDAVISRIDMAVRQVLQDESVGKRMHVFGTEPEYMPHAAFVERVHADTAHFARIIQEAGIGIER
jgi:tripartite-type tricarboxylate transporter receptor subunit TctC